MLCRTEGAVEMVKLGYNEDTRCLGFRVRFYHDPDGVKTALRVIDQYNGYDAETVIGALSHWIDECWAVDVGREGSPVLYFATSGLSVDDLNRLYADAMSAYVDEIGPGDRAVNAPFTTPADTVRVWWD